MKDVAAEYVLAFCEIVAGIGIMYIMAKFAPAFMAVIR